MTKEELHDEIAEIVIVFSTSLSVLGFEAVMSGLIDGNDEKFADAINHIADGIEELHAWVDGHV